jgi:hypothetical protein
MRYVISVPDFSSTSMYFREGWKADSNICGGTLDQKILWVGPVATFRWDHAMTASSSPSRAAATAAATNTAAMGEQHIRESIARTPLPPSPPTPPLFNNLHEYFKPVFDEVDKLNKMLDSSIEEEKMIDEKRNDHRYQGG